MRLYLWTDGACRGNPGPAGIGGIAKTYDDARNLKKVFTFSAFIGHSTNNRAEYRALHEGLSRCLEDNKLRPTEIDCYLDSELVVRQMTKEYTVNDALYELYKATYGMVVRNERNVKIRFHHIPRSQNHEADALANAALNKAARPFLEGRSDNLG